jgi:3-hydroxyacyl-CoA dehydrogenase
MGRLNAAVDLAIEGEVAVLTLDSPPVNALSAELRAGIIDGLAQAMAAPAVRAVVLICAGRTFVAGADIREFGKPPQPPSLTEVLAALDASTKPVVAAIHGTALGGGLELALACHWRVATTSAQLGLPEVKLGLIPGGGGTQRTPRLIGFEAALSLITTGEPAPAARALDLGLVDALTTEETLRGEAVGFALTVIAEARPLRRTRDLPAPPADPLLFDQALAKAGKTRRGFEAPRAAIAAVEAASRLPFDEGLAEERKLFETLRDGEQSKAQRYIFFAERTAKTIPGLEDDVPVPPIRRIGVVGAGTMGGGIAMAFAAAGLPVVLLEATPEALDRGLKTLRQTLERAVKAGRVPAVEAQARLDRIGGTLDIADLADADLILEAVFESMELKQEIFGRLDAIAKPGAILASNTSYLDIDTIAATTGRPGQVLGLHFFSPAQVMRVVEVVRGGKTSKPTLKRALAIVRRMGKIGVVAGVCHGFVGNRMQAQRQRQANKLIVEGAAPSDVDRVLYQFGMPMGPFAMLDMAGLDIGWFPGKPAATIRDRLCELGRKGQKSGAGFYDYGDDRKPVPAEVVDQAIREFAAGVGVVRRAISDQEILDRCLLPMINEGAKILEEGIALRSSDIDLVWVHGFGWPAYRGGPMFYADNLGLNAIVERLEDLERDHGEDFRAARLLRTLAAEGRGFDP